jgi:hypothetical protein
MSVMNGHESAPTLFDSAPKPRRNAGFKGAIAIHAKLNQVLDQIGDGLVEYKEGYSDRKVAEELGGEVSRNSVAYVRAECFGHLKRSAPQAAAPVSSDIDVRLSVLERTMDDVLHALSMQHIPKRAK